MFASLFLTMILFTLFSFTFIFLNSLYFFRPTLTFALTDLPTRAQDCSTVKSANVWRLSGWFCAKIVDLRKLFSLVSPSPFFFPPFLTVGPDLCIRHIWKSMRLISKSRELLLVNLRKHSQIMCCMWRVKQITEYIFWLTWRVAGESHFLQLLWWIYKFQKVNLMWYS